MICKDILKEQLKWFMCEMNIDKILVGNLIYGNKTINNVLFMCNKDRIIMYATYTLSNNRHTGSSILQLKDHTVYFIQVDDCCITLHVFTVSEDGASTFSILADNTVDYLIKSINSFMNRAANLKAYDYATADEPKVALPEPYRCCDLGIIRKMIN